MGCERAQAVEQNSKGPVDDGAGVVTSFRRHAGAPQQGKYLGHADVEAYGAYALGVAQKVCQRFAHLRSLVCLLCFDIDPCAVQSVRQSLLTRCVRDDLREESEEPGLWLCGNAQPGSFVKQQVYPRRNDRRIEGFLGGEVPVHGTDTNSGSACDLVHAGGQSLLAEHDLGRREHLPRLRAASERIMPVSSDRAPLTSGI